ncbi:hypothetical protein H2200_000340 [Cladophialophora chaetospira]|uniref:EF-hand domain-containing protein n=1 Tax=Cladophialophora chaetospira TaxID=386627 RepID=A0AA38XNK4_9EURO|nr:hypothetical protein H2200_000340 [Cladophialophora chaetospira]
MEKTTQASVVECRDSSSTPDISETESKHLSNNSLLKKSNTGLGRHAERLTHNRRRQKRPLPLDRVARSLRKTPQAIRIALFVVLSGLPFAAYMLVARFKLRHKWIGPPELHATHFKLSKWLMFCWASLLIIFALAESLARLASWACSLSTGTLKYQPLAKTLCFRVTLLAWAGAAHEANCIVWPDPPHKIKDDWPATLRQVFVFLVVSFSILLVQGIVLQLIAIRYVEGYMGPRSQRAFNELETIRDLNSLVKQHFEAGDMSFVVKILKKVFLPVRAGAFDTIVSGKGTEEMHRDYAASIWNTVTTDLNTKVLTAADISRRLVAMGRDPEPAEDLFAQLDESCDGEVTREELEALVISTGRQLNKRAESMKGIRSLLHKLEALLTLIVFGAIVFIYSNFFNQSWVKDSKALWTGVTGLGFALNGTITEFVNSCVFVFSKHAYDIGDLLEVKSKKLVVRDIHLTHTNFKEIRGDDADATGMIVQISHAALSSEVIVNWTRSNDLMITQKEQAQATEGDPPKSGSA